MSKSNKKKYLSFFFILKYPITDNDYPEFACQSTTRRHYYFQYLKYVRKVQKIFILDLKYLFDPPSLPPHGQQRRYLLQCGMLTDTQLKQNYQQ